MKKQLLFSFIAIILSTSLSAQHHFPKDSAEWSVYYEFTQGPVEHKTLRKHSYTKDTVLMGNQYMKITPGYSGPFSGYEMSYIREVDSTQKIYILLNDGAGMSEQVLYDFSKTVGDSISIPVYPYGTPDTITWYVFNEGQVNIGQQQRRYMDLEFIGSNPFQHGDSVYMDRWIEGIGSVRGLYAPFLEDGSIGIGESLRYHLVCFQDKGDSIQYEPELLQDSTFLESLMYTYYDSISDCNTAPWNNLSGKETQLEFSEIEVYPNPFTEEFKLDNLTTSTGNYTLLTNDGQEVLKGELRPHEVITVKTDHLPKGVYILKAITENGVHTINILSQ